MGADRHSLHGPAGWSERTRIVRAGRDGELHVPDKVMSGNSPKFTCVIPPDDEVKVKFGRENGEVYAEVAATRLFWALGFPADRMYPVRVRLCRVPSSPDTTRTMPSGGPLRSRPRSSESSKAGRSRPSPDSGWAWPELDTVDETAGGAPRAQRDALKLLAVFVQHTDNKAAQQRLLCVETRTRRSGHGALRRIR